MRRVGGEERKRTRARTGGKRADAMGRDGTLGRYCALVTKAVRRVSDRHLTLSVAARGAAVVLARPPSRTVSHHLWRVRPPHAALRRKEHLNNLLAQNVDI